MRVCKRMIRLISYNDVRHVPELLAEYAAECSNPALGRFNPQWSMYAHLEESGVLTAFGAYSGDELVGFASVLVSILPHFGNKAATCESLFVRKSERAVGLGTELLSAVRAHSTHVEHCSHIFYIAPIGSQLEALLERDKRTHRTNSVFCETLSV